MLFSQNNEPRDNRRGNRKKGITPTALEVGQPAYPMEENYLHNGMFPYHEGYFPVDPPDSYKGIPDNSYEKRQYDTDQ